MQRPALILVLAALAGLGAWLLRGNPASEAGLRPEATGDRVVEPDRTMEEVERLEVEESPARTSAEGTEEPTRAAPSGRRDGGEEPTGRLRIEVIDGTTGAGLERFTLRTLSEERFASRTSASPLQLDVSPGSYEGLVLAPGRDPLVLEPFTVQSGELTDLGRVVPARGSASISGAVHTRHLTVDEQLGVELFGAGRNRCAACADTAADAEAAPGTAAGADPCGACGFGLDRSSRTMQSGQSYRFDGLAAGSYALVVRDGTRTLLASREVTLEPAQELVVEFDLALVDLELSLLDDTGAPFDGDWIEDGVTYSDWLRLSFWADGVASAATRIRPLEGHDLPEDPVDPGPSAEPLEDSGRRHEGPGPGRADVERRSWHTLWPHRSPTTGLRTRALRHERLGPGRYRIRGVPAETDVAQLVCGPAFSDPTPVGPEDRSGVLELTLDRRCSISGEQFAKLEGVKCNACHQLPDLLLPE